MKKSRNIQLRILDNVSPYLDVTGSSIYKVEFHISVQKVEIKCSIFQEIERVP